MKKNIITFLDTLLIVGFIITLVSDFLINPLSGSVDFATDWHYPLMALMFLVLYILGKFE